MIFSNVTNGKVKIDNTNMDYISFGKGDRCLVIIPGLGDGLKTIRGYAIPFSILYRKYAKKYRVYVFSRKNQLTEGYSTRDMAKELMCALCQLKITKADVLGVSLGGMIAQYLAIDYPSVVNKLVLAVTLAEPNGTAINVIHGWIEMAKANDYKKLLTDISEKTYSEKYLAKNRWLYPLIGRLGKPKDFSRFVIMATACLNHNAYSEGNKITCPTLIISGDSDKIVTHRASTEIAEWIKGSELFVYEGLGHGAYEEAKDFNSRVLAFFDR